MEDQPHSHGGHEKSDDPAGGVYPFGTDPAQELLGIGQSQVGDQHDGQHSQRYGNQVDKSS